ETGDRGALALARTLAKADRAAQVNICTALNRYRGKADGVAAAVGELLKSDDKFVVHTAITTLQTYGPRAAAAMPATVHLLKDNRRDVNLRLRVAMLIGTVGPAAKKAVPGLVELLKDEKANDPPRLEAARALGSIGPSARAAVPALVALLKDDRPNFRLTAL